MLLNTLLLVLASGSANESGTEAASNAAPARERRICRVQERLGTILPRRVCRTATEWQQIDAAQQEITERDASHMRNRRSSLHCGPNPADGGLLPGRPK